MAQTDDHLVKQSLSGDRDAFCVLVARYRDMVYGMSYHLCKNFEEARDLAQEAFIQAYLRLDQLREPAKFAPWLRQIAINLHRGHKRSPKIATVPLEEGDEQMTAPQPEMEIVVRDALAKLQEPERLALTLHYINGYTQSEIGSFLGVQPTTVKTRLARARQHLRKEIMAMVEDTFDKKKLPEEFAQKTVEEAIKRAEEHIKERRSGAAYWEYVNVIKDAGISTTIQGYQSLLAKKPDYVPALVGLGFAQREIGEYEDSIRHLRRALEMDPQNELGWIALWQLLKSQQRFKEADELYEQRQKVKPASPASYHTMLGESLRIMGKLSEAEQEFRLALAAEPQDKHAGTAYFLGMVLREMGRYDESVTVFREAAESMPDDEYVRWELAVSCRAAGQTDLAIASLRESLLLKGQGSWGMRVEWSLATLERCYHDKNQLEVFPSVCRELHDEMTDKDRAARLQWYLALFLESRLLKDEALAEFQSLGAIPARYWRVLMSFDNTDGHGMTTTFPPEKKIDLSATYTGIMNRVIRWERPQCEGAGFELNFLWNVPIYTRSSWSVAYALLRVMNPKAREAVFHFYTSSVSPAQIWLNGESIFGGCVHFGLDSGRAPLKLKQGKNDILVKMGVQEAQPSLRGLGYFWSLFSRITDKAGEPIRDLKFPLGE